MSLLGWTRFPASTTWDALDQLRREVDGLFLRASATPARAGVFPPVNFYETAEDYVLTAELPGMRHEDLDVAVEGQQLTVRGERKIEIPDDGKTNVHRRERQAGTFRRTVELPGEVDADKVQAVYRNGVLLVKLPKSAAQKPRRISVQTS